MSKDKALDYFERHQASNECHITSDGRVFHTKGAADGFAGGLKDTTVKTYKRDERTAESTEVNDPEFVNPQDEAPVYTVEDLKAFDPETADYHAAKNLVKGLGLESASQSKVDLFEAIATAKANLEA